MGRLGASAFGFAAGLAGGGVMALPKPDVFIIGNAINLTVMISLWLGTLLRAPVNRTAFWQEVIVGGVSLLLVAMTFQVDEYLLVVAFAVQALWAFTHEGERYGVAVRAWYPSFAGFICLGMMVIILARFGGFL